jgi:gluconolactonase
VSWEPSLRYPDPKVRSLHPSFDRLRLGLASVERLWTGARWAEGPVWFGDARHLLFSDIPNDRILKWDEESGAVSVFRRGGYSNGNTRDREGRLVTCEHGNRRVTRTERDGRIEVLIDRFEGKRLNSPNDVVVRSDGTVWFTDPPFGLLSEYEGAIAEPELPENVYRLDPRTGEASVVAAGISAPNGLAFSPDERVLYVVASRPPRAILAFDVAGDALENRRTLVDAAPHGTPDGFRCDARGNLWCGWGMGSDELDGVRVFSPDGEAIGHISLPERCSNLCFGGAKRNRLFMAASHSLYALYVNAEGAAGG